MKEGPTSERTPATSSKCEASTFDREFKSSQELLEAGYCELWDALAAFAPNSWIEKSLGVDTNGYSLGTRFSLPRGTQGALNELALAMKCGRVRGYAKKGDTSQLHEPIDPSPLHEPIDGLAYFVLSEIGVVDVLEGPDGTKLYDPRFRDTRRRCKFVLPEIKAELLRRYNTGLLPKHPHMTDVATDMAAWARANLDPASGIYPDEESIRVELTKFRSQHRSKFRRPEEKNVGKL